ncbi:hypothetical protein ViNHUV68_31990 [Vibrio sp. NH-UV-68]
MADLWHRWLEIVAVQRVGFNNTFEATMVRQIDAFRVKHELVQYSHNKFNSN